MSKYRNYKTSQSHQLVKDLVDRMIKTKQREYDNETYETKSPGDKLNCQICGGKYTRHKKTTHMRTTKHKHKIDEIHNRVNNLFD